MIFIIAAATFFLTLVGGFFSLHFKDRLHLVLGFSAGAVVGVAFFDLIPESMEIGKDFFSESTISVFMALGFLFYLVLDRMLFFHSHGTDEHDTHAHAVSGRGILGAASLAFHSFLDGFAVGVGFQISTAVGAAVTIAVLAHGFSDGINTVNMILKSGGSARTAFKWLLLDAVAPVTGILSTLFLTLPEKSLGVILALFSGSFLYIGASELIPESHHAHPRLFTTAMTVLGAGVLFVIIQVAGL